MAEKEIVALYQGRLDHLFDTSRLASVLETIPYTTANPMLERLLPALAIASVPRAA
jgi:hypothetical protein